jgi:hypothetical protein
MDTTKSYFVQQANKYGILHVRERNSEEDLTGWGALQFLLNNGEIFVVSGRQFGQGPGEDGLWVDVHGLTKEAFNELKQNLPLQEKVNVDLEDLEKTQIEDYLSHHINEDTLKNTM